MIDKQKNSLGYNLKVFKTPKMGSKPPTVVSISSNSSFHKKAQQHAAGYKLSGEVHAYGQLANGVDRANQLALKHREVGSFQLLNSALLSLSCDTPL